MKRSMLLAAAGLILTAPACQKKDEATPTSLVGEWRWVATTGGLTGTQTYTPASTGVAVTWVFRPDSTLLVQTTARPDQMGTYSVGTVQSIFSGQPARSLTLHLPQAQTYILRELGSRLVVADNYPDGFGHTYQRQ